MKSQAIALAVLFVTNLALADGLPLKDGRFSGRVLEFDLTQNQKKVIEHFRTCHLENSNTMNVYTPYVFALTPSQARAVRRQIGFVPSRFGVYETFRGFNDAGSHWNLALRYSESRIEVPVDLLLPDRKAKEAHQAQGWKEINPCFPNLPPQ